MKFVSPRVHGVLDYLYAALFFAAPFWLDFTSRTARLSCFVFAGAILLLSVLTRYPLGVVRVIPFTVHGGIEFVAALALIAMPWLAGFQDALIARNFFLATGIVLFGLWMTTDYKAAEASRPSEFGRGGMPSRA